MKTKNTKFRNAAQTAKPTFLRQNSALIAVGAAVLLAGLAYAKMGGGQGDPVATVRAFVKQEVSEPLNAYRDTTGQFPATAQGLKALIARPSGAPEWAGPYLKETKVPTDPWGSPYQYAYPGHHNGAKTYDVWSKGPDKLTGTADDIGNW